jgi:hypothetical protein
MKKSAYRRNVLLDPFWPILIYVVMSVAISVSAGLRSGFWVAIHAGGTSVLALGAGGGLRASLRGGTSRKLWGGIYAAVILGLALWVSMGFSAQLFGYSVSGPIWATIDFVVCLVFGDRKRTGS